MISGQAKPQLPPSSPAKRAGFATYSWIIAGIMLSVIAVIIVKSFIKVWMYNWSFATGHYQFNIPGGTGVLWMSLWISIFVGFFGALLTLLNGYIIEKKKPFFAQPLYLF
ncbi:MAG: hypothetical protein J7K04_07430, partial [Spirochaetales bacterium]|nr:hypothetical protein [Spirochaetales bacterium]